MSSIPDAWVCFRVLINEVEAIFPAKRKIKPPRTLPRPVSLGFLVFVFSLCPLVLLRVRVRVRICPMAARALISRLPSVSLSPVLSSGFFASRARFFARPSSPLLPLRSLLPLADSFHLPVYGGRGGEVRSFSTRPTTSSLNDPSPNWSNRPPKETILLDGCDFEHWLIVLEPPDPSLTRDEIIDSYIKTLAQVLERLGFSAFPLSALLCLLNFVTSIVIRLAWKVEEVLLNPSLSIYFCGILCLGCGGLAFSNLDASSPGFGVHASCVL